MKIDFDQKLTNMKGNKLEEPAPTKEDPNKTKNIFLKDICVNALLSPPAQEANPETGVEKMKNYLLGIRITEGGTIEVTPQGSLTCWAPALT